MKKIESINNPKFKGFEKSEIAELAHIVGGAAPQTDYYGQCAFDYEYERKTVTGGKDTYITTTCAGDTADAPAPGAPQI